MEDILLRLRLDDGLDLGILTGAGVQTARQAADDGLLDTVRLAGGRAVLTLRGRLLADGIALQLVD
jgi:oxygen-independent coproporphyrinogen-3 oxidase